MKSIKHWFKRKSDAEVETDDKIKVNRKVKIGLALGGGGTRGIGHIGALMAFEELGIKFDYIAGTSSGSVIGALYAFGKTPNEIRDIAKGMGKRYLTKGSIPFLKPIKSSKLENTLNDIFGDLTVFSELKIPFCAVCTNLINGKEVDFDYGNLAKVLSASCSVPALFTPVVYEGMHLVDGGLRNNVPADVVKKMGANVVFAIDVNHLRGKGTNSLSTVSILAQTIGIIMQSKVDDALDDAELIFKPALETFSPLKFEHIDEMIKVGYDTVMANKDKIQKMLGLNPKKIDNYFTKEK